MKDLRDVLQGILVRKCSELRNIPVNEIDHPVLQEEINDIEYMLTHIDSSARHFCKLSAIKAINQKTTSATVYDTVNNYISDETKKVIVKSGLVVGIGAVVGFAVYRNIKKSRKKVK